MACEFIPFLGTEGVCDGCGKGLVGRQTRWCSGKCSNTYYHQHDWNGARSLALKRDGGKCVHCGSAQRLEVNHIVPRLGQGYGFGCWNHLDGLESLCKPCHQIVTNQQREARKEALAS